MRLPLNITERIISKRQESSGYSLFSGCNKNFEARPGCRNFGCYDPCNVVAAAGDHEAALDVHHRPLKLHDAAPGKTPPWRSWSHSRAGMTLNDLFFQGPAVITIVITISNLMFTRNS